MIGEKLLRNLLGDNRGIAARTVVDDYVYLYIINNGRSHDIRCFIHHLRVQHAVDHGTKGVSPCVGVLVTHAPRCHQPDDGTLARIQKLTAGKAKLPAQRREPGPVGEHLSHAVLFKDLKDRISQ